MKKLFTLFLGLLAFSLFSQTPNFAWAKQFGGPNNEKPAAMVTDASGNVYITGDFTGTTDFDPGPGTFNMSTVGNDDIFVCKLDASGNLVWAKRMGGTNDDVPKSIALDASGNVYTTGLFYSIDGDFDPGPGTFTLSGSNGFYSDAFISKLDALGNFVWAGQFSGTNTEYANDITIDASGNIFLTGAFSGTVDFDPGVSTSTLTASASAAFITKLSASGNFIWAKQFDTNSGRGNCITTDASGNIYSAGHFVSTTDFDPGVGSYNLSCLGITDIYISKLDAAGNFVWAKQMGGSGYDDAVDIKIDPSGNVGLVGNFEGTADLDPGAATLNFTSAGSDDFFISKLNSAGNLMWAHVFGGPSSDKGASLAISAGGDFYTTGNFQSSAIDMDPGAGTFNLSTGGTFISRLDASGNFGWAGAVGGAGNAITLDASGNIYVSGYFSGGVADFDPGTGTANLTATADDAFILKLTSSLSAISESHSNDNSVQLYPNPTSGSFNVLQNATDANHIEIYNSIGSLIYSAEVKESNISIDLTGNSTGIYFVKVTTEQGSVTKKLLKN